MDIKISNTWKKGIGWVNVNGAWKKGVAAWVNVNGTWKKMAYATIGVFKSKRVKLTSESSRTYTTYKSNWISPEDPSVVWRSSCSFRNYGGPTSSTAVFMSIQFKTFPDGVSTYAQKTAWLKDYMNKITNRKGRLLRINSSKKGYRDIHSGNYDFKVARAVYSSGGKIGSVTFEITGSESNQLELWGKTVYDSGSELWMEVLEV